MKKILPESPEVKPQTDAEDSRRKLRETELRRAYAARRAGRLQEEIDLLTLPKPLEDYEPLCKANRDRRFIAHANEISEKRLDLEKRRRRAVRESIDRATKARKA